MSDFLRFRDNIVRRMPQNLLDNVFKITTNKIEDIYIQASNYFNVPVDELHFEIEAFQESTFFQESEYVIIAYPNVEYSFVDKETNVIKNIHGEYFVRNGKGLVYLMVTPAEEGGHSVVVPEVLTNLQVRQYITNLDKTLVRRIVTESAGVWYKIGEFEYDEENDYTASIEITKDHMSASILIKPAKPNGADITAADIYALLSKNNIVYGIRDALVDRLEKKPVYNQWIEIAVGDPVEHGENSKIVIVNENEVSKTKTASLRVKNKNEYSFVNSLVAVTKGEIIARKIPFTEGRNGITIFNDVIFSESGKDIEMIGNANVKINDDNTEAIALLDGSVYVKDNCVYVDELMVFESDLTHDMGNLNFPGSVIVKGSIGDDFKIRVDGNLTVQGSIGNSEIYVGRNLVVWQGIHGKGNGHIEVKGSFLARFIEVMNVKVGDICAVIDSVIGSNIMSFNKILVYQGKGRVSSSVIIAEKEIVIKKVGSVMGTGTELQVVSYPEEREKLKQITHKIQKIRNEITNYKNFFGDSLNKKSLENMNDSQKEQVKNILILLKKAQNELKMNIAISNNIKMKIENSSSDVRIHVLEDINLGTKITLNDFTTVMKNDSSSKTFFIKDGTITSRYINNIADIIKKNEHDTLG